MVLGGKLLLRTSLHVHHGALQRLQRLLVALVVVDHSSRMGYGILRRRRLLLLLLLVGLIQVAGSGH